MKKPARLLLLVTALFWFSQYTYPVLLTGHVISALGASAAYAGLIVGSYGFTQMVLRIPVGFATDALGRRKPFILGGMLMAVVAGTLLFVAGAPGLALLGRGSAGVAAASWACFTVLYASYQSEDRRTHAMGTLSSVMYGAQLLATLSGSLLARFFGTRASFLLAACAGMLGLLLAGRIRETPAQGPAFSPRAVLAVGRDRLLWLTALISIMMQVVLWSTLYGFGPAWAQQVLGASEGQLGWLSAVHLLPTVVLSFAVGPVLAPRLGEKRVCILGFLLLFASCLAVPWTRSFGQMLCLQALCGAGIGCAAPVLLSLCIRNIAPASRGLAMGAYQSLYGIGMFLGPTVAGNLVDAIAGPGASLAALSRGYSAVYYLAAGVAVAGALLSLLLPGAQAKTCVE